MESNFNTVQVMDSMKQKVQLFISCRKLKNLDAMSKSDPQVEVYLKERTQQNWMLIGKTEIVNNNLNPDFSTFISCDYYFEREQNIMFKVYDIDNLKSGEKDFIGQNETTVAKLFGSLQQTYVADLMTNKSGEKRGKIIVRLDDVKMTNDEVRMKVSANLTPMTVMCCSGINNPYYVLSRARYANIANDFVRIYQSSTLMNNTKPVFPPQKIKIAQLCKDDRDLPIKIAFYSEDKAGTDQFYGEATTTVFKLLSGENQLILRKNLKNAGTVTLDQFSVFQLPNFTEYLRSGWAINTSFAIDFTASNGIIQQRNSLHYQDPTNQVLNQYEQAIIGVGKIIEPYAMNSQFATFGFGGVPTYMGAREVTHCFNINGTPNPAIIGLQNVFNAYKFAIKNTALGGPTLFSHFLKALLDYVKGCLQLQMYHCMIIITDGDIHDMKQTIDFIVELSQYPVSIIIIGVGNEDFENMRYLDSDEKVLRNSQGMAAQRDIVQFVKFQDYSKDISLLAEEVLREMPDQIVSYMVSKNIQPLKLEWQNVDAAVMNGGLQ